ncbi:ABC transporter permease [Clostridium tepidum]|jgi:putative ABC transport system permease protein|uniref:MacB-like periplasmic core domain-containing protein n=1 Tax=Clostridium tepidum TaxID=1962263 RepID=A0A1S9I7F6_9CLOT|nr:ABC transporter permease [Clostridium tepidum]MCR1935422.1 ABC transporter permease [Clostridium tepidum]MDU6877006.1 ABC transporter permease [Clostridium botulinum]OOO66203.1 hypothetical protein BS638_07525 [Clostridium tepidum]
MRGLKKFFRKTYFLILSLIFVLTFISLSIGYVNKIYEMMLEANNFKTENNIIFMFNKENLKTEDLIKAFNKIKLEKNIILTHEAGKVFIPGAAQVGIYFNGVYKNPYNLLEGRFFTKEDFKDNSKIAVIGKNLLSNVEEKDGKKYIYRGNEEFLVIGVIGKENRETQYDYRIFYNLNIDLQDKDTAYLKQRWILDSITKNKNSLKDILNSINKNNGEDFIKTIYENNPISPLKAAIYNSQFLLFNFFIIIMCIIVSLIRATVYWIEKISLEIGVRKLYGASNLNIVAYIVKRYLIISGFALICSLALQRLLLFIDIFRIQNDTLNIFNIIGSLIFILIIGIIFICTSIVNINKVEISQLIKGKV